MTRKLERLKKEARAMAEARGHILKRRFVCYRVDNRGYNRWFCICRACLLSVEIDTVADAIWGGCIDFICYERDFV